MPLPVYQHLMLPLLRVSSDGEEHSLAKALESIQIDLKLSDEELNELLPSGTQSKIRNRLAWARFYLVKAGLLLATGRGKFRITQRGKDILNNPPPEIDNTFLSQFPEFVEFFSRSRQARTSAADSNPAESSSSQQTPEEALAAIFQALQRDLGHELLEQLMKSPPEFFERFVVDLLVAMGYGGSRRDAGEAIGRSGDDGIDGIIKEDRLGLDAVYVQAKRWKGTVGRPDVQAFAGSLEGHRARKGVFITTSQFSNDARDYVSRIEKKIILIDGQQLASLSIEYKVGVADVTSYHVRKLDLDYFEE